MPAGESEFEGQDVQVEGVAAIAVEYVLMLQLVHLLANVPSLYVPVAHGAHVQSLNQVSCILT